MNCRPSYPPEEPAPPPPAGRADQEEGDVDETVLHPDELTALYQFLADSLRESGPHGLVRLALSTLLRQTRADLVGFRSLDADDLLIVLPEQARVDARLSSRMTQEGPE